MGKAENNHDAWMDWMHSVPQDVRVRIAKVIREANLETAQGLVGLTQSIMAEVASGTLPPAISQELREWCRLIHDQLVAASMVGSATGNSFVGNVNLFMQEALRAPNPQLPENLIDAGELSRSIQLEKRKALR